MEISIVGAIVLVYTIGLIIYCAGSMELFAIKCSEMSIILCLFFDIGYVMKVGGFELEYNYYFTFLAFVSILLCRTMTFDRKVRKYFWLLIYLIIVVAIHSLLGTTFLSSSFRIEGGWEGAFLRGSLDEVQNQIGQVFMPLLRMLIFGIIICFLSQTGKMNSIDNVSRCLYYISMVYLFVLGIEFILINFTGLDFRKLIISLFGNSSSTAMDYRTLMGLKIPLGLSREPSSLAFQCIIIFASNLYFFTKSKKGRMIIFLYLLVLILSQSMSSVMYLLAAGFLIFHLFQGDNKTIISFFIPIVMFFGVIIAYSLFSGRFELLGKEILNFNNEFGSFTTNSTIIRLFSVYNNITYLIRHPLLGTGLYSIYSFSALITIFTNFGLIGMILYCRFYKECILSMTNRLYMNNKLVIVAILCFLFTGLPGQILYYPQSFYFFTVSFLVLSVKENEDNYGVSISYENI